MPSTHKRPRYALRLEAIGDNESFSALGMFGLPQRYWAAKILGINNFNNFVRTFLKGARDYTRANSQGSRGIFVTFYLEEGPIYEISSPKSWKHTDRHFARIVNGEVIRMTKNEVLACLAK